MAGFREEHITVNGVRLRYLDWGTTGKPSLVCLHGHTGQAHIWDEFAEATSPHYRVLCVDQRGHGGSEWAKTGYARDRFVEDLSAFADALELDRFVLVGHSMGGWNSLLYGADQAERVEKMVVVDIGPEPGPAYLEEAAKRAPRPLEFASFDDGLEWARRKDPWATASRLRKDVSDKLRERDDALWTWKADPALFVKTLPDMVDPGLIARYWKALEAIACPILLVRGTESALLSDALIERMARAAKRLQAVDVSGAGHNVSVDKPREFIEATRSFLGLAS